MRNDVDFQNICPSPKFGARIVLLLQEKILKLSWCIKGIFVWCIRGFFPFPAIITGGTNQGPAYYQECVSLFGKKVFMKPVNE